MGWGWPARRPGYDPRLSTIGVPPTRAAHPRVGILAGVRPQLQRLGAILEPVGIAPAEALALLVLLLGAASLTGVVWWTGQPRGAAPASAPPGVLGASELPAPTPGAPLGAGLPLPSTAPGSAAQSGSAASGPVVVHVAGQVVAPGVVSLPAGARVAEAIEAAGGATDLALLDAVNLARTLVDGEQVRVPGPGETVAPLPTPPAPGPGGEGGAAGAERAPLDLNAATIADLDELPGVGPVMAERIVAHREAIGGFAAVTQLLEVSGIGPARFAELEPRVRVGP